MNGFLLIDKPEGITSFYCVKVLRRFSGVRRIGFAGTLDPLATGLMIFAIGEATKLITFLEKSDKVYDVKIRLGAFSDTYDAQGKIEEVKNARKPLRSTIIKILEDEFAGPRQQEPPAYSAVHIEGKRAYDLARRGEKFKLKKRPVQFYDIKVKSYAWPFLKLTVHCSSGTYVRSLAHDLGRALKCGGYVEQLRRLKIGLYSVKNAVSMGILDHVNLRKHVIMPQDFFKEWRQLELDEEQYKLLSNGGYTSLGGRFASGPVMAIYRGKCAGVLEVDKGKLKFAKKFNIV